MDASALGTTAPSAIYEVGSRRFEISSRGFAEAIADAHAAHQRPRCMCLVDGVEMYVARLGDGYIVKRMPETGSHHAPNCPSYEPPAELSGLGQMLGSAISEDPATGETTLKLDFPLATMAGRSTMPPTSGEGDCASSTGAKLSLRGLLHYLWNQAELTRWHPGFAGKRTWATVRRHLLQAAEHKMVRGDALRTRLYVPEPFSIERRGAINARRLAQWHHAVGAPGVPQPLMVLIGEVKEIVPARYGFKVIVKHMPDQAFPIDEQLYRGLGRRFEPELALWGCADDVHMVVIATFGVTDSGVPAIHELSLMLVTPEWLPVEDGFERLLIERLVIERRSFVKGLRYNLGKATELVNATLTDCGADARLMFIVPPGGQDQVRSFAKADALAPPWRWDPLDPSSEGMPPLPARLHGSG